jgi:putative ATP-dependent endonuclease of the OLD family
VAKHTKSSSIAARPTSAPLLVPKEVKPTSPNRSRLVRMSVANIGCVGPQGIQIALDDIVCLVGVNNCGKSTVLRAYEAAANSTPLLTDEIHSQANGAPATVELWVHIPEGAENIPAKWKESEGGFLLVRSKWEWPKADVKPTRTTWDPEEKKYADDGKAAGLDTVFNSRLPKPFRIGSLENPTEEHAKLLDLILGPIKQKLAELIGDKTSGLFASIEDVRKEAEKPVSAFRADVDRVQGRVNQSYKRVFSAAEVQINVALGDLRIDPMKALLQASRVDIVEGHGPTPWHRQGTGSQRTLFWSMLEVRSELRRIEEERRRRISDRAATEQKLREAEAKLVTLKQEAARERTRNDIAALNEKLRAMPPAGGEPDGTTAGPFLPGHMLLIDEPETALHPSAVRAAKDYLYALAADPGWQVMLSTHHPAFVDPLARHTTIVRLHRPDARTSPNVYRADDVFFTGEDEQNLKALLAFDQSVAEMFFSSRVVIIEGDTEFAAFTVVMDEDLAAFPVEGRPLLLRARGKWTIPPLVRILAHFKVNFAVLHDIDAPRIKGGSRRSGAFTANKDISDAVRDARTKVHVIHRNSLPEFERHHGIHLTTKDKPFETWKAVRKDPAIRKTVREVLDALCAVPDADSAKHPDDGEHFESRVRVWAAKHAPTEPEFAFDGG